MRQARPLLGFLCRFVIVFGLLVAPWPGWREAYARGLQKSAATVLGASGTQGIHTVIQMGKDVSVVADFGAFGPRGIVAFAGNPARDEMLDTIIYVGNRERRSEDGQRAVKMIYFSSRFWAYLPVALVTALVLATGVSWRRRLAALVWALVWIHFYIAFVLGLMIVSTIGHNPELGLMVISPFWRNIVSFLQELFAVHGGTHLAIAVPIWIAVTFRKDDWVKLLGREAAAAPLAG